jgi:hypothetical protein
MADLTTKSLTAEPMAATIDHQRYKVVDAEWIDDHELAFKCPFCFTRHNKDGSPHRLASPIVHRYPSGGDRSRRDRLFAADCEPRTPLWPYGFPDTKYAGYCVKVTTGTGGSTPTP